MNDLFTVIAFLGLAAIFAARLMKPRTGRIVFWAATTITCVSAFLMAYPPDWSTGLLMAFGIGCLIIVAAYINTEFIVVRGKTRSLFAELDADENYGGGLTPRKAWWLMTLGVTMAILIGLTYLVTKSWEWAPAASVVVAILAGLSMGYRDALMGKPVAAGQRLQFGLISVVTVGIFTVAYLYFYMTCRRRLKQRPAYGRHADGSRP
ncbi:hypothetical protein [Mycobacterium sp. 852002-51961_SCH5331710]|uniref:hypothetical protein n=1 Tax=Mycobacterium sp. 852002-51961_SCH5331710 TaxID=1834105 RepID=UPI0007FC03DF|nr:hypothetical protein [Mycobacterium sp. 852002-51961_SCH5331710]OBB44662.1 hypothetical protein A5752_03750 [Mycobacterium sp. 852002-51961_SCH5331710]